MDWILISKAASLTGLDRQTIRNWMYKGIVPYNKISDTFYVDKDTFLSLAEPMRDLQKAQDAIKEAFDGLEKDKEVYRTMREDFELDKAKNRYLSICVNAGIRTAFFDIILDMQKELGLLKENEADVLHTLLYGSTFEDIAKARNTGRERIRQIAEKAIRKSRDFRKVIERLSEVDKLEEEIANLKNENDVLKRMVFKKSAEMVSVELNEDEKKLLSWDKYELNKLMSEKLVNCDLSVRAYNCLYCYKEKGVMKPIKTIGDLCKISRLDYMQQRNAGKKTADELEAFLKSKGLSWDIDIDKVMSIKV